MNPSKELEKQALDRRRLGRVLVLGASGFIGSALFARLSGLETDALIGTSRAGTAGSLSLDLTDTDAVEQAMAGIRPDTVFQTAGYVTGERTLEAVLPSLQTNLVGTVNLLSACARHGSPILVLASSHEEPDAGEGFPVPRSPYSAAKFAASTYARYFHHIHGLPVVTLRITMGFGPSQRDEHKLVPYLINSLLRRERPALTSGSRLVDWVYEDDIVDAFLMAAEKSEAIGATVDVGSGKLHSVRHVAEHLRDLIDPTAELHFGALPDRPMERSKEADVATAHRILGWRSRIGLHEGLRRTAQGYGALLLAPDQRTEAASAASQKRNPP